METELELLVRLPARLRQVYVVQGAVLARDSRHPTSSIPKTHHIDNDHKATPVRALVVEDNEPFRRFVCSTLGELPELQIVCEVSDGLEAVQKAEELQPDLIVLDIGLPSLNGIEAARRIRKLSPNSKILFASQDSASDVVQEALSLGALGYVLKAHAATDLLAAVEAILRSEQFVSPTLINANGQR
jgi:DNA-binding NarL/FixJ family response regulator